MPTRPFEYSLEVGCRLDLARRRAVEGRIVNGPDDFSGGFVAQLEEMGEIIFAKGVIVFLQTAYALLFLRSVFPDKTFRVGDALHLPTVFLPFLLHFFEFRYRGHRPCLDC